MEVGQERKSHMSGSWLGASVPLHVTSHSPVGYTSFLPRQSQGSVTRGYRQKLQASADLRSRTQSMPLPSYAICQGKSQGWPDPCGGEIHSTLNGRSGEDQEHGLPRSMGTGFWNGRKGSHRQPTTLDDA